MAVREVRTDDIDGSTADVQVVRFGLDGTAYAIDLSSHNAEALRQTLAPFVAAARRADTVTGTRTRSKGSKVTTGSSPAQVRAWAMDNGIDVPTRGRIPRSVHDAYVAARPN